MIPIILTEAGMHDHLVHHPKNQGGGHDPEKALTEYSGMRILPAKLEQNMSLSCCLIFWGVCQRLPPLAVQCNSQHTPLLSLTKIPTDIILCLVSTVSNNAVCPRMLHEAE